MSFKTSLAIGLAIPGPLGRGLRVGVAGYHVSNGGLAHPNNRTEALVLFVATAVGFSR